LAVLKQHAEVLEHGLGLAGLTLDLLKSTNSVNTAENALRRVSSELSSSSDVAGRNQGVELLYVDLISTRKVKARGEGQSKLLVAARDEFSLTL